MPRSSIATILLLLLLLPMATACGLMKKGAPPAAVPASGKAKLTGEQIDQLVRGNTLIMEEYGVRARVELHANGSLHAFKQDVNDQTRGSWAIEEDTLCLKFKRWGSGDELCYAVHKVGEEYHQYAPTGLLANRFTVTTGVGSDPGAVKARRPHQTETPTVGPTRSAATGQPNVVATAPSPPASSPTIQDATAKSSSPETARRDLDALYRDMTQDCPGCNLANINLAKANLVRANLAGANLSGANLSGANLKWANLKGTNLAGANLAGANLAGAELAGANLERADFTGASLTKANLRGANIEGAIGMNLREAIR